jgi:hypothetical protein
MRSILILAALSTACANTRDAAAGNAELAADSVSKSSVGGQAPSAQPAPAPGNVPQVVQKLRTDPEAPIRGLYVNRFAAQSTKKMQKLSPYTLQLAQDTIYSQ